MKIMVVGATGDVGRGVVRRAVHHGWQVVAVARNESRLAALADEHADTGAVRTRTGSIADDPAAAALAAEHAAAGIDAVVVSVNSPYTRRKLLEWSPADLHALLRANLTPHLAAARHRLGLVRPGGTYLGVDGGMADVVMRGSGPMSVVQAGQRMLYRALAKDATGDVHIRELILASMIDVGGTDPGRLTDDEAGE